LLLSETFWKVLSGFVRLLLEEDDERTEGRAPSGVSFYEKSQTVLMKLLKNTRSFLIQQFSQLSIVSQSSKVRRSTDKLSPFQKPQLKKQKNSSFRVHLMKI
jgi:hypothetical protein